MALSVFAAPAPTPTPSSGVTDPGDVLGRWSRDRSRRAAAIEREKNAASRALQKAQEAARQAAAEMNKFSYDRVIERAKEEFMPDPRSSPHVSLTLGGEARKSIVTAFPAERFPVGTADEPVPAAAVNKIVSTVTAGFNVIQQAVDSKKDQLKSNDDFMKLTKAEEKDAERTKYREFFSSTLGRAPYAVDLGKAFKTAPSFVTAGDQLRISFVARDNPSIQSDPNWSRFQVTRYDLSPRWRFWGHAWLIAALVNQLEQIAGAAEEPHMGLFFDFGTDPKRRPTLKSDVGYFQEAIVGIGEAADKGTKIYAAMKQEFDTAAGKFNQAKNDIAKNEKTIEDNAKKLEDIQNEEPPKPPQTAKSDANKNPNSKGSGSGSPDPSSTPSQQQQAGQGGGQGGGGDGGKGNAGKLEPGKIDSLGQLPRLELQPPIADVPVDGSRFAFVGGKDGSVLPGEVGVQGYKTGQIGSPFRNGRTPAAQSAFANAKTPNLSNLVQQTGGSPGSPIANSGAGAAAAAAAPGGGGGNASGTASNIAPGGNPGFDGAALNLPNEPGEYRSKNDFVRLVDYGGGGEGGGGGGGGEADSIVAKGGASGGGPGGGGEIVIGRGANQLKTARRLRNKQGLGLMGYVGAFGELCAKELQGKASDVCGKAVNYRPIEGLVAAKPVESAPSETAVVTRGPAGDKKFLKPSEAKPTL